MVELLAVPPGVWRKTLLVVSAGFVLLAAVTGCGGKKANQLVVGVELASPPFDMTDEQNQPTGIDIELARALAKSLGKELVIRNTAFAGLIPALQTGKIDLILSSMTITAERARTIDFSDPYVHMGICLLVNAKSDVQKPDDLNRPQRKVVVKNGTTGFFYAQEHLPQAQLLQVSEAGACVLEVVQGKADAFIYDQFSVFQYQRQNPLTTRAVLEPLRKEDWGIGVRKGDGALLRQVNAFLANFREQHGLDTIAAKYLAADRDAFQKMGSPFSFEQ